jgi:hypothetical protein
MEGFPEPSCCFSCREVIGKNKKTTHIRHYRTQKMPDTIHDLVMAQDYLEQRKDTAEKKAAGYKRLNIQKNSL